MRKTINIEIGNADVRACMANAFKQNPTGSRREVVLARELAACAGSRYLQGGSSSYRVLSRGLQPGSDMPGANVSFVGLPIKKREEIWELAVEIPKEERRKGWLYVPVAISPVLNSGSEEKPLYRAFALILGFREEDPEISGALKFKALDTTAPFPLRWERNGGDDVQWPIRSGGGASAPRPRGAQNREEQK